MEMIVIGWLVLELTDSPWQVALIGFYRMAPLLAVGFLSGPAIDRFGRRNIILASQATNLLVSAVIVLLLWTGRIAFWHLAVSALILGITWAIDWPARRTLVPDLVGKARTVDAVLLESVVQNISRIIGPFLSGTLIDAFGATGCYATLTGINGLALLCLLGLSRQPVARDPDAPSPWALIVEGLRYVRRNQPIFGVLLITLVMNLLAFPYLALLPVFARDILNQGPVGLGILGTANGVGALIGVFVVNHFRRSVTLGWIFAAGSILQCAMLVGFSASTDFSLSVLLLILTGVGQACFVVLQSAIVLLKASDDMRSRAMGTVVFAIGAGPPGRLVIGALAEAHGAPFALGLLTTVSALLVVLFTVALPELRTKTTQE